MQANFESNHCCRKFKRPENEGKFCFLGILFLAVGALFVVLGSVFMTDGAVL